MGNRKLGRILDYKGQPKVKIYRTGKIGTGGRSYKLVTHSELNRMKRMGKRLRERI